MTKSTITREQLEEWVAQFDEDGGCDATDRQLEALIRQSLAAMDSEPVAYTDERNLGYIDRGRETAYLWGKQNSEASDVALYRHAQPVPVVPKEMTAGIAVKHWEGGRGSIESFVAGYNFCRAAMLAAAPQQHGSELATVPGKWIPVSEQMPPSRHEVLVGRWWGEKPRWCCKWATYIPGHPDAQSSGWLIPGASWTPTHWMPLPAAPQEVKSE
ncbi:DUF551 domain-containing protein [Klebsiella pneumoniae]|uniref:DUF551 domain-containing protein n=1 Tax=Klebsiella pneumoniae TaxID=573 RepID=UPI003A4D3A2B